MSRHEWRQPTPEQLDCEKKLEHYLASLVLQGTIHNGKASYDHVDRDYAARAIAPYLEQAQTLGKGYAARQVEQVERGIGNVFKSVGDRARDLVDRVLDWASNLFVERIEGLGEEVAEAEVEQVLEGVAEQVAETLAVTEIQTVIEQVVMQELQAAQVAMIEWIAEPDACPVCLGNAEQGAIPLGQAFNSGDTTAPAHHQCRCHIRAVQ